jgi:hypothetical protein
MGRRCRGRSSTPTPPFRGRSAIFSAIVVDAPPASLNLVRQKNSSIQPNQVNHHTGIFRCIPLDFAQTRRLLL